MDCPWGAEKSRTAEGVNVRYRTAVPWMWACLEGASGSLAAMVTRWCWGPLRFLRERVAVSGVSSPGASSRLSRREEVPPQLVRTWLM